MELKKGDVAISKHPYAFRSGKQYTVLNIQKDPNERLCYFIQFEDGYIDWFPVNDIKSHDVHLVGNKEDGTK